jgi:hypothetical protein
MNDAISSALSLAPLVLAQSPVIGATELGQWLLVGAAVAVILNQGMGAFKNITGEFARKQTPREEGVPTAIDCEKKHLAIAAQFQTLQKEWEADREKLHKRINTIAEGVTYIRGKLDK